MPFIWSRYKEMMVFRLKSTLEMYGGWASNLKITFLRKVHMCPEQKDENEENVETKPRIYVLFISEIR